MTLITAHWLPLQFTTRHAICHEIVEEVFLLQGSFICFNPLMGKCKNIGARKQKWQEPSSIPFSLLPPLNMYVFNRAICEADMTSKEAVGPGTTISNKPLYRRPAFPHSHPLRLFLYDIGSLWRQMPSFHFPSVPFSSLLLRYTDRNSQDCIPSPCASIYHISKDFPGSRASSRDRRLSERPHGRVQLDIHHALKARKKKH